MTVKDFCATTNHEMCIHFPPFYDKTCCWAVNTKSLGTSDKIPNWLLGYEIDLINIEIDPWDISYFEIFLKDS